MEFLDVVRKRKTTNGPFLPDPVPEEHQRLLVTAAGMAPSQLNSQPWRFVVIEDRNGCHLQVDGVSDKVEVVRVR